MSEKSIPLIKIKITLVAKNNYKHAEKVLFQGRNEVYGIRDHSAGI